MAIDVQVDTKVQEATTTPQTETKTESQVVEREYGPTEQQALNRGWTPKEEWEADGKDPSEWRSAKEFLDRGELLDRIKDQSREIKQITAIVGQLSEHNRRVYESGYRKALNDLRGARAQALEDRDTVKLVQIEEAIDNTKEALRKIEQAPAPQPGPVQETEAFKDFKGRNSWYSSSQGMRHWAHGMAIEYANQNPQASEEDVYRFIEREVKKEFPQKFTGRQAPPSPDGASSRQSAGARGTPSGGQAFEKLLASMPEDQARVARDMVKRGYVTKEKYVEDYNNIVGA